MQESKCFHYICIVIRKDGTGVNLKMEDPPQADEVDPISQKYYEDSVE